MAILLIVTVTSQAALAFSMPCRGTSDCCCTAPVMDMTAAMHAGMGSNCCDATPDRQPCDIQTTASVTAAAYLASPGAGHGDSGSAFQSIAIPVDPAPAGAISVRHFRAISDRGSPPAYLQNQSFLC